MMGVAGGELHALLLQNTLLFAVQNKPLGMSREMKNIFVTHLDYFLRSSLIIAVQVTLTREQTITWENY
jgi:hypothetical protein